ncbi:MAG: hypothetical protein ACLGJD_10845 [Gammaproteobacteria bacterium]|jgi:hypothetical protein|uniref:hypothetical protein n=1 Tax=uncultured Pseudacidovorax sp. TaxID=679313 RepID=UPI0025F549D9|nr:hypothetical protein [uncultured Pseudacidovorax sp.]
MNSKSSSKVKSPKFEPTVLLAVTPALLNDLGISSRQLSAWGQVSSEAFDVEENVAYLPAKPKTLQIFVPFAKSAGTGASLTEMLSPSAMAASMNCTTATVYDREKKGHLFSVTPPGRTNGRQFPGFQLHNRLDNALLARLIAEYRKRDVPFGLLWEFLKSSHDALAGATGAEILVGNWPDRSGIDTERLSAIYALPEDERREFVVELALEDITHAFR